MPRATALKSSLGATPVDDLVAWLTQIWDEQEKAARDRWTMNPLAPPIEVQYGGGINPDMVTVSAPGSRLTRTMTPEEYQRTYLLPAPDERALARIAADRQILELHTGPHECPFWDGNGEFWEDLYCPTTLLLAKAHADRPGFRDEWRVTA